MPIPNPHLGRLIVFEGIDGSGKSTQARILADTLRAGVQVIETAEPTRGKYGRQLRAKFATGQRFTPEEEATLFALDRADHTHDLLLPALEARAIVVQDRTWLSSLAYQSDSKLPEGRIIDMNAGALIPDVCFWLDTQPHIALNRIDARWRFHGGSEPNLMERDCMLQHAQGVYSAWEQSAKWIHRIDTSYKYEDDIADDIMETLLNIPGFF